MVANLFVEYMSSAFSLKNLYNFLRSLYNMGTYTEIVIVLKTFLRNTK